MVSRRQQSRGTKEQVQQEEQDVDDDAICGPGVAVLPALCPGNAIILFGSS